MRFPLAFVLSAVLATLAFAAPDVKVTSDPQKEYADPGVDQWFDLLVNVDPKGAPIKAEGLTVVVDAGLGAEAKPAILPAPDASGNYQKPFAIRVPVKLSDELRHEIKVTLGGTAAGSGIIKVRAASTQGHVSGTAKLKKPAVAGEANAVVLELTVIEPYHVYGTAIGDEGIPFVATLVPGMAAKPGQGFSGGARTNLEGKNIHGGFTVEIPFTPARAGKLSLRAFLSWQACTDQVCDPQEIAYIPLTFDVKPGEKAVPVPAATPDKPAADPVIGPGEGSGDDATDIARKSIWEIILLSIGGGLFALVMPCTYPLIPITISFFTKQAEQREGKVAGLALAYGAGIVGVFVVAGVLVGQVILVFAALWWVNLIFALMFLFFGLSLIGLFEIRLPSSLNNLAGKVSGTGGYMSVFAMGTTLVITSFTCTAPFVGSILVFAAAGGSTWTVALAMAVFGLTMAIPFVFLSLSPKGLQAMPKSGMWMKTLKVTLGIIELGLVLKFVSNVDVALNNPYYIRRGLFLVLWAVSFLAAGLYLLRPFALLKYGAKWDVGLWRGVFGTLMLAIAVYLGTGAGGAQRANIVEAFAPPNHEYSRAFLAVVHEDYEQGVKVAMEKGAPIFLHFTGWV